MTGLKNLAKRATMGVTPDSPQKKWKKKNGQPVDLGIQSLRLALLKRQLNEMSNRQPQTKSGSFDFPSTSTAESTSTPSCPTTPHLDPEMPPLNAGLLDSYDCDVDEALPPSSPCSPDKPSRKDEEEDKKRRWNETMKLMVDPLLDYWDRTVGKYPEDVARPPSNPCSSGSCVVDIATIHTIYFNYHRIETFHHCRCRMLPQVLVAHGLFPTSSSQPWMAISLDLLEFYRTLCQQSSDAVTALANALSSLYRGRGLRLLGTSGEAMQDPIRRALGNSLQWYDTLVNEVDQYVTQKIETIKQSLPVLDVPATHPSPLATSTAYTLLLKSPAPVSPIPTTSTTAPTASSPAPTILSPAPTTSNQPSAPETLGEEPPPASAGSRSPRPPSQGSCDPYLQRLELSRMRLARSIKHLYAISNNSPNSSHSFQNALKVSNQQFAAMGATRGLKVTGPGIDEEPLVGSLPTTLLPPPRTDMASPKKPKKEDVQAIFKARLGWFSPPA
ncbi:hypothetical protein AAF712_011246 [Marasmius tenuissimus]|uniref:CxC1-like cysteine cluster associated with KDZ transposases domain-containing protein n=1 Tax=Marasmius tenuissimus TaxID=585030 RepID=A0ABR2ZKN7_9AGAR